MAEFVGKGSSLAGDSRVSPGGNDSKGLFNLSLVVALGLSIGPDASLGDIDHIENVLLVDVLSILVSDLDVNGPGTGGLAISGDDSLDLVESSPGGEVSRGV